MRELDINELQALYSALGEITGYLTDNSCSDPDCCGGPFYELSEFDAGVDMLEQYGLTVNRYTALDPIYEQERNGS